MRWLPAALALVVGGCAASGPSRSFGTGLYPGSAASPGPRAQVSDDPRQEEADPGQEARRRRRKALRYNLGGLGFVTLYGLVFWDWATSGFHVKDEGWLGENTRHGGADKLGHAWTGTALTAISAGLYRRWGYGPEEAALYGAASGALFTAMIEVGDGFSEDHGFSTEDLVFNVGGAGFEYLRQRYPEFGQRVQFRWQWVPSRAFRDGAIGDPSTDYSGSRYLLAFPLRGWGVGARPWRYMEVLAGVYARGYRKAEPFYDTERAAFLGIGLNLTSIFEATLDHSAWHTFDYFQLPVYLDTDWVDPVP